MAGCLSQAWIASIAADLRVSLVAKSAAPSSCPCPPEIEAMGSLSAASSGPLLDCLRTVVEKREDSPYEIDDLKHDRSWQKRFHTAMLGVLRDEYGEPLPQRHGPFVPETFTGDILALTRGMF